MTKRGAVRLTSTRAELLGAVMGGQHQILRKQLSSGGVLRSEARRREGAPGAPQRRRKHAGLGIACLPGD